MIDILYMNEYGNITPHELNICQLQLWIQFWIVILDWYHWALFGIHTRRADSYDTICFFFLILIFDTQSSLEDVFILFVFWGWNYHYGDNMCKTIKSFLKPNGLSILSCRRSKIPLIVYHLCPTGDILFLYFLSLDTIASKSKPLLWGNTPLRQ